MSRPQSLAIIGAGDFQLPLVMRARQLGLETHVFAWEEGAVAKPHADHFHPISITETQAICRVCREVGVDAAASIGSDLATHTVNYIQRRLGNPCNPEITDTIATDKYEMRRAFQAAEGGYRAPVQTAGSFLGAAHPIDRVTPSYAPGVTESDLRGILPPVIGETIARALPLFGGKLKGFDAPWAVLTGPETRSSSPVRMERDDSLQSPGLRGLYPCGEGAGWAGGIMSAALDGIKCAEAVIASFNGGAI